MKTTNDKYYWVKLYESIEPEPMLKTIYGWSRCAGINYVAEDTIETIGDEVIYVSNCISEDMHAMHNKYHVHDSIFNMDAPTLKEFIWFRARCMQEELDETIEAISTCDADGVVDGIIDLMVFAAGTLDLLRVDFRTAWSRVFAANMNKTVGIKEGRRNPLGLPDLIKNDTWVAPQHTDNTGLLNKAFTES